MNEKILNDIKLEVEKLCGIADYISYNYCDDETAEAIDKIEYNITQLINSI